MTLAGPRLLVDRKAIAANYRCARRVFKGKEVTAVVKADAYGLGLEPVATTLDGAGCRRFWVADIGEGIRLRRLLPAAIIYVMHGLTGQSPADFAAADLMPVIARLGELQRCADWSRRHGAMAVAVQLDTGLNRLGLDRSEVALLQRHRDWLAGLRIDAWVTQLARFSDPDAPNNRLQRRRFRRWTNALPAAPRSLATSAMVFQSRDWHFDLARIGSALYGVQTTPAYPQPLAPVVSLHAPVLRVADSPPGARVGYGSDFRLPRRARIATVALGYADGLPVALAGEGNAFIGGRPVPLVGNIAMNLVSLDVSALTDDQVQPGTEVEFIGPHQSLESVAARLGWSPNALLLSVSRAPHHYAGSWTP